MNLSTSFSFSKLWAMPSPYDLGRREKGDRETCLSRPWRLWWHVHSQYDGLCHGSDGLTLPYSASIPATDLAKLEECRKAGAAIKHLLEKDIRPKQIMTRKAFENAIVTATALGGSTNVILHLIAVSRAVGVNLTLRDFQAINDKVPLLADFKPSGKYVMKDLHLIGGLPAVLKLLLKEGLLHGDCLTVTGKTLAENLAPASRISPLASRSFIPFLNRSNPKAIFTSSKGMWPRRVPWQKLQGKRASLSKGLPEFSIRKTK